MDKLILPLMSESDIEPSLANTPIAELIQYHNFQAPFRSYQQATVLVGTCMDHREGLRLPEQFAYTLRMAGGNLRNSDFQISYAVAVGGVTAMALITHAQCGMVNLERKRHPFVDGLVRQCGWTVEEAEQHFQNASPQFEIGNENDFLQTEVVRLRQRYPGILIVPLIYRVEDNRLYRICEMAS